MDNLKENSLVNIGLFDKYLGTGYLNDYGTGYLIKCLCVFKQRYKEVRREYLRLYRNNISYKKNYENELRERCDYYSYMGIGYMFGIDQSTLPDFDHYSKESKPKFHDTEYLLSCISPEYCKSRMRSCEIELHFLKVNMVVIRKAVKEKQKLHR